MFGKIFLEISNLCNLACSFCPPTLRRAASLSRVDFELFLDRLEGFGNHLYFHVKGEPLLHPSLGEFLDAAGERGFAVTLTSNGTLLAEKASILLGAKNLRKLSVSLHSHSGSSDTEEYWRGVEAFLDRHRAMPAFPVSLRLWNRDSGQLPPEAALLWELIRERYPTALGAWESQGTQAPGIPLDDRVYLNQAERFDWPELSLPRAETRGFCHGLRNQIGILAEGTVVPCCLDGEGVMALGNIRELPLREILDSPRARAIREGFSRGELVEPLCRSCGYRRRFSLIESRYSDDPRRGGPADPRK
jgi:radical SAM protein with 4Fe4S-binding SPASM domain